MMNIKNNIKLATIADSKELEKLAKICDVYKTRNKLTWAQELFEIFIKDPNSLVYICNNGNIIGCVVARYNDDYSKLHIYNIFVNPNYQNNGIGKTLLEHLITDAKAHGTDYICTLNTQAHRYFEKQHFSKGKIYLWQKLDSFALQNQNNMI